MVTVITGCRTPIAHRKRMEEVANSSAMYVAAVGMEVGAAVGIDVGNPEGAVVGDMVGRNVGAFTSSPTL